MVSQCDPVQNRSTTPQMRALALLCGYMAHSISKPNFLGSAGAFHGSLLCQLIGVHCLDR